MNLEQFLKNLEEFPNSTIDTLNEHLQKMKENKISVSEFKCETYDFDWIDIRDILKDKYGYVLNKYTKILEPKKEDKEDLKLTDDELIILKELIKDYSEHHNFIFLGTPYDDIKTTSLRISERVLDRLKETQKKYKHLKYEQFVSFILEEGLRKYK